MDINQFYKAKLYCTCLFIIISQAFIFAKDYSAKTESLKYSVDYEDTGYFDANRIRTGIENNNLIVSHRITGMSGMEWPKGAHTFINYASGLWFAGKVDGEVRTSIAKYKTEFIPGPLGSDPENENYRLYKINRRDLENPLGNPDIADWPVVDGAPWIDADDDGIYNPIPTGLDTPLVSGDQTIWYVCNDGDSTNHYYYNSKALGIEIQNTIWGYDRLDHFGDVMFIKSLIINRGGNQIDSMYFGVDADPDLGDASDDFAGCDTLLGLGYCYNDGPDMEYGAGNTPALGYDIIQGPIVESEGDTARAFSKLIHGYKNLSMSSFVVTNGDNPEMLWPYNSIELYNIMQGLSCPGIPIDILADSLYPEENLNLTGGSRFMFPGDPVQNTDANDSEVVDSDNWVSSDRRFNLCSGSFSMAPGDSQEVIIAMMVARDKTALGSVTRLKKLDQMVQKVADNFFQLPEDTTFYDYVLVGEFEILADNLNDNGIANNGEMVRLIYQTANISSDTLDISIAVTPLSRKIIIEDNYSQVIDELLPWPETFNLPEEEAILLYVPPDYSESEVELRFDIGLSGTDIWNRHVLSLPVEILGYEPDPNVYWCSHVTGNADGRVGFRLIDPADINNHTYQLTFSNSRIVVPEKEFLTKVVDCSKTTMDAEAYYSDNNTHMLLFELSMNCASNWIDGIQLSFPANVKINNWGSVGNCQYTGQNCVNLEGTIDELNNYIIWGDSSHSEFGAISSNDEVTINIDGDVTYPIEIRWKIWDDGYDGTIVDAEGIITIDTVRYEIVEETSLNLYNVTTGTWLLENYPFPEEYQFEYPVTEGFKLVAEKAPKDLKWIGATANGDGPLNPPVDAVSDAYFLSYIVAGGDYTNQQVNGTIWLLHNPPNYGYSEDNFISRVFDYSGGYSHSPSGIAALIPNNFEVRFTGSGKAYAAWGGDTLVDVPFEWWNVGPDDDPSDDYKLIPWIVDEDGNAKWNLQIGKDYSDPADADHGVSDGLDDPWTDRIHVHSPVDDTPGSLGYDNFVTAIEAGNTFIGPWYGGPGDNGDPGGPTDTWLVMARTSFVLLDGGDVATAESPADYTAEQPEIGTVFKIVTMKNITDNDVFQFNPTLLAADEIAITPTEFNLMQNYPNPFNPVTTIRYTIAREEQVELVIYNLLGQVVCTLVNRIEQPGNHRIMWDGKNKFGLPVSSGVYFYQIRAGNYVQTRKMVLLK